MFCAHSQQTIIEQKHPKWTARSNENIDTQIAFESVHQQRFLNIFLDNDVLVRRNPLGVSHQQNAAHPLLDYDHGRPDKNFPGANPLQLLSSPCVDSIYPLHFTRLSKISSPFTTPFCHNNSYNSEQFTAGDRPNLE